MKTLDAQGKLKARGSGVLLPSGRVATNCHVVEGGVSYLVGRGNQLVPATLYAEDGDKDICLLDAKGITGKSVQLGKAASLKVGVPVYAVGAPIGLELSLSDGIVAQLRGGPPPLIQTTAAISPGSSGGGLFDGNGRLVGLTTLYIVGGQNLNFAMPVEWIGEIKPGRKAVASGRSQIELEKHATALEKMKDWEGLLDWSRKWTKSDPKNANAWGNLGIAYGHLNRYDDAVEAYRQASRIDPEWPMTGTASGSLTGISSATTKPLRPIVRPCALIPSLPDHSLGFAYDHLKRYDDASRPIARPCLSIRKILMSGSASDSLTTGSSATMTKLRFTARPCVSIRKMPRLGAPSGTPTSYTSIAPTMPLRPIVRPCASIRKMLMSG